MRTAGPMHLNGMVDGMGRYGSVISDFVLFLVCCRMVDAVTRDS